MRQIPCKLLPVFAALLFTVPAFAADKSIARTGLNRVVLILFIFILFGGCAQLTKKGVQIKVIRNPERVKGCEFISEVSSYSGWGGALAQEAGYQDAMNKIKNETAKINGDTLLIFQSKASFGGARMTGEAYNCKNRLKIEEPKIEVIKKDKIEIEQAIEEPKIEVIKKDKIEIEQAVVLPIGVLGEISETKKTIINNKFMEVISNDFDLISQEEYERAEEEAFQELDYEECTEDQCIKMIQEILQVENMYKIQLVKDGNDIQVSLTYIDLDKKLVQTDFCEDCKTSALIKMINQLYLDLGEKR